MVAFDLGEGGASMKFIKILITLVVIWIVPTLAFFISLIVPQGIAVYSKFIGSEGSLTALRVASILYILFALAVLAFRKTIYSLWKKLLDDFQRVNAIAAIESAGHTMPLLTHVLFWSMVGFSAYTLYLCFTSVNGYMAYVNEDGPVENAQAIFWGLASLTFLISIFVDRKSSKPKAIVYILLTLFCFICLGEEVSWGQRIFNYKINAITAINKQNEMNLHNIGSISLYEYPMVIGSFLLFVLGPFFLSRYKKIAGYLRYYDLPNLHKVLRSIFATGLIAWFIVGIRFGTLGFSPYTKWGYYTQADDEIYEFIIPYCFFCFAILDLAMRIKRKKAGAEQATQLRDMETNSLSETAS